MLQLVEQPPELFIEESEAIVVAVTDHLDVTCPHPGLVRPHVIEEIPVIPKCLGPDTETALIIPRGNVRLVGVEVVQEGEEGAIRPPSRQPVQERLVDLARASGLEADPLLDVEAAQIHHVLEDPLAVNRATEQGPRSERVILVMSEAASQAGLVITAVGVRHESRGLISA